MGALEKHYSVQEVAKLWQLSEGTIIRLFRDEVGVFTIGSPESKFKRRKITLRIPESILIRVHEQRRVKRT